MSPKTPWMRCPRSPTTPASTGPGVHAAAEDRPVGLADGRGAPLQLERGSGALQRVVGLVAALVEDGEDLVADEVLHLAVEVVDDHRRELAEVGGEHAVDRLGPVLLAERREAGEVGEQHRHLPLARERLVEVERAEALLEPLALRGGGDREEADRHQQVPLPPAQLPARRERGEHDHERLGQQREGERDREGELGAGAAPRSGSTARPRTRTPRRRSARTPRAPPRRPPARPSRAAAGARPATAPPTARAARGRRRRARGRGGRSRARSAAGTRSRRPPRAARRPRARPASPARTRRSPSPAARPAWRARAARGTRRWPGTRARSAAAARPCACARPRSPPRASPALTTPATSTIQKCAGWSSQRASIDGAARSSTITAIGSASTVTIFRATR